LNNFLFFGAREYIIVNVMPWGLAAAQIGMTLDFFTRNKFNSLRIILKKNKNQNGQSDLQDKQIYFDIHRD
jgi:hypothetical protein